MHIYCIYQKRQNHHDLLSNHTFQNLLPPVKASMKPAASVTDWIALLPTPFGKSERASCNMKEDKELIPLAVKIVFKKC